MGTETGKRAMSSLDALDVCHFLDRKALSLQRSLSLFNTHYDDITMVTLPALFMSLPLIGSFTESSPISCIYFHFFEKTIPVSNSVVFYYRVQPDNFPVFKIIVEGAEKIKFQYCFFSSELTLAPFQTIQEDKEAGSSLQKDKKL